MLILGGNQLAAGGYNVDNGLRFNDGSNDNIARTPSSASNRRTWTLSFWIKRGVISTGTVQTVFGVNNGITDSTNFEINFDGSTDRLQVLLWNVFIFKTDALFKDPSAWYHIVFALDTTQGTSSNRAKLYVNGVQVTDFNTTNYPGSNAQYAVNNTASHRFGLINYVSAGGLNRPFDGYLSEITFIDGQQLDATSFGEFDEDSGIWKPIDVSGLSFGTNGYYLQFQDSSALGDDTSGNSNDFTVNNLTSIDQSTDTPTNNFCTMNPLITRSGTAATYSEGNLKVVWSHSVNVPTMGTLGVQSGKWYYESKMFWGSNSYIGITYDSTPTNTDVTGYLLRQTGQKYDAFTGSGSSYTSALSSGDTVMIAFDADNGTLWFGVNGTWSNGATQTEIENGTTTNAAFSSIDMSYIWLPMGKGGISSNARIEANFGNPIYTISSGNSDGNGYGNFEYTVPNGYYSWNTKNLAEFG